MSNQSKRTHMKLTTVGGSTALIGIEHDTIVWADDGWAQELVGGKADDTLWRLRQQRGVVAVREDPQTSG